MRPTAWAPRGLGSQALLASFARSASPKRKFSGIKAGSTGLTSLRQCLRLVVAGDLRAAIENLGVAFCNAAVEIQELRVEIAARFRLEGKMPVAVLAPPEGRAVRAGDWGHACWDVADREANSPVVRWVRRRAVHEAHVVKGHLTRAQRDDPPLGPSHLDHSLLSARKQIVFGEGVAVGNLIELVAAGDVLHRPVRLDGFREGEPGCHDVGAAQTPISGILVPGHEGRIGRLLDEEVGGPAQEIRAVEILNRVEDSAMADELRQPSEK